MGYCGLIRVGMFKIGEKRIRRNITLTLVTDGLVFLKICEQNSRAVGINVEFTKPHSRRSV